MCMVRKAMIILAVLLLSGCVRQYTISFSTEGSEIAPVVVRGDEAVPELPVPEREGYDFTGWYRDRGHYDKWTDRSRVTMDTTLFAAWEPQKRTVSFETFGGTKLPEVTVDYGTVTSLGGLTVEKEGMKFAGWYMDEDCTQPYDESLPVTADMTLYAGWEGAVHVELVVREFINQAAAGAREGCEGASLLMALQMTGHALEYDYYSFLDEIPYSPDSSPYKGFAGSLWEDTPEIDAMMPGPVTEWGSRYGTTVDLTGCDTAQLIGCLKKEHPVIVWTSIHFQPSQLIEYEWGTYKEFNHVMLLIGYDEETNRYKIADPAGWNGGIYWVSEETFLASWDSYKGAVEVY